MGDTGKGYWASVNDSEFGQFVGFASNFAGWAGIFVNLGMTIFSQLSQSDTDQILNAISGLKQDLAEGVAQLGDEIKVQAKQTQDTINRDENAAALSHSDAALDGIDSYIRTKDQVVLDLAVSEAVQGVSFYLELNQSPPDLFFMPGLIKAGTTRILAAGIENPAYLENAPNVAAELHTQTLLLRSMINTMKQSVDAAHVVTMKTHTIHSYRPRTVIDGFEHEELIPDDHEGVTPHRLDYFKVAGEPTEDPDSPEAQLARRRAEAARNEGVAIELADMGLAGFEQIQERWLIADGSVHIVKPVL